MRNVSRGMAAGLAATLALSALMIVKATFGLLPEVDVIGLLAEASATSRTLGWIIHLVIGIVLWGGLFARFYPYVPGSNPLRKGLVFATAGWLVMMLVVLPLAGVGLFGLGVGMILPVMTLLLHWVFGTILGAAYGRSARRVKTVVRDETAPAEEQASRDPRHDRPTIGR